MQAWADDVNFHAKTLTLEESSAENLHQGKTDVSWEIRSRNVASERLRPTAAQKGKLWNVKYDKLVVAVGCYSNTFGTKGVKENAYFLKDVTDSRRIRNRVLECFEKAALPTTSDALKRQLLSFAVVGGGPTGMEFSAELSDFVRQDVAHLYPDLQPFVRVTVYDVAPKVLSMFDANLGKYALETFKREGIQVKTSYHVLELRKGLPNHMAGAQISPEAAEGCYTMVTKEDGEMGIGMCVWSTGNMMNPFIEKALSKVHAFPSASAKLAQPDPNISLEKEDWVIKRDPRTGAVIVDPHLRVQIHTKVSRNTKTTSVQQPKLTAIVQDVFALGDNAMVENTSLPATAQTANQEAKWLGTRLNKGDIEKQTFTFRNLGIMAYLGGYRAVFQAGGGLGNISGRLAWLIWRGAYMTKSVSWRNKILIPVYWFFNWALGRDVSRF